MIAIKLNYAFVLSSMLFMCSAQFALAEDDFGAYAGFQAHVNASNKSYSYQVVSDPVREGQEAFRFEVRPGDCGGSDCKNDRERVERREAGGSEPGKEYWYSYSIFLDPTFASASPSPTILGQWKQEPVSPQIMSLEAEKDQLLLILKDTSSDEGNCCAIDLPVMSIASARGKWVDLAFHVKWSTESSGFVELYVNGNRKHRYDGRTAYDAQNDISFRFGVYRSFVGRHAAAGTKPPVQIVYFDNVKRGKTQAHIEP